MESTRANLPLRGVGITGYRSIRHTQVLGPLSKVTLIAGRNNAGKSNFLRFIGSLLKADPQPREWHDTPDPLGSPRLSASVAFARPQLSERLKNQSTRLDLLWDSRPLRLVSESDDVWIRFGLSDRGFWELDEEFLTEVHSAAPGEALAAVRAASSEFTGSSGGQPTADLKRTLGHLFPFAAPPVATVDAFRQISSEGHTAGHDAGHSGRNLIERLAALMNPEAQNYDASRARFDAITDFARSVFDDPDVEIQIPNGGGTINIRREGRTLPLNSMGTGIHQVIILAAAASTLENTVVCIEEPEVHLHPVLQRKLVRYLCEQTTNQYVIATHSAHMLDFERASIFHVRHDPIAGTVVAPAATPQEISDICGDLGYRPSDLLQANAVVWVEGPSDRIYLRHWVEMLCPGEFVEGIHYSIMFYGGSLLRHLTADDPYVSDFISLRRLNRHSAILIDSDKKTSRESIGQTKERVRDEFNREGMPGFAWITDGRTIENYVPTDVLAEAVNDVHSSTAYTPPAGKWDDPLPLRSPLKVQIARAACDRWDGDLERKLARQVMDLAEFIRAANSDETMRSPGR